MFFADEIKVDSPDAPNKATIIAVTPWGMLRGMESFSHLVYTTSETSVSIVVLHKL